MTSSKWRLAVVALAFLVSISAYAQVPSVSTPGSAPVLRLPVSAGQQIYNMALRRTKPLDEAAMKVADDYLNSADAFGIVDLTIIAAGDAVGQALARRNPGKGAVISVVVETQVNPELFRNYLTFKSLYGCAVADTLSADEIKQFTALKGNARGQPFAPKILEAQQRFRVAAYVLGNLLFAQMTVLQLDRLRPYGLDLTLSNQNDASKSVQTIQVPSGTPVVPKTVQTVKLRAPLAVGSERAVLYEEDPKPDGLSFPGSVTWRLEPEGTNSPGGKIHADIRIEDRINAVLTLSRTPQVDGSTADRVKIEFRPKDGEEGDIASVAGMVTKLNPQSKAIPIIAAPFQGVRNTFFLEFTNTELARQQNLRLLKDQTSLEILFVHKDGHRGVISLTKGMSGTDVIKRALASWK
ncbi:MAG TPA: hypothetical protein VH684_20755 [Xanthobacteraceae bacterium]|jgi:hypothetical protein